MAYDPYELLMADEPTAAEMAKAYAAQLRGERGLGLLGQASGDRVLSGLGQSLQRGYQGGNEQLQQAAVARLREVAQRRQAAQQQAQRDEEMGLRRQEFGLRKEQLGQDAWAAVPDASGGTVLYNRKTGEFRPLGPQGPGSGGGYVGKPKDMENDIQSAGKDLESLAKMRTDLDALQKASTLGDQPGFGPVAGKLPDMLTSGDGVALRQAAGRIMANIIKETSGSAASEAEVERLLQSRGLGRNATPEAFKQGVQALGDEFQTLIAQREAKYQPAVIDTYGKRGGFTSKQLGKKTDEPPVPGAVKTKSGKWAAPNAQGQLEYLED